MHNPEPEDKISSYAEIIDELLAAANGPAPIDALADQILARRPSTAKNPHRAVLAKIRAQAGRQLVYLDAAHVPPQHLPLRPAPGPSTRASRPAD